MEQGFTSFEADIFLKKGKLILAHFSPLLKHRTLEDLYLKPLYDSIIKNKGFSYPSYSKPLILLVDIKSDADETYAALKPVLERYKEILSCSENGSIQEKALTVILSGNKPYKTLRNEDHRLAFIDEGLMTITQSDVPASLCPLASTNYSNVMSWKGKGRILKSEEEALLQLVSSAHVQGKKIRLWATPENEIVWKKLLEYGIDLINTDEPERLKNFLLSEHQ